MKKLIKDYIQLPSQAIQLMIDGVRKQTQRKDFVLDSETYGGCDVDRKICFGCFATCALQELAGVDLTVETIAPATSRFKAVGFSDVDLNYFEGAIDAFRRGYINTFDEYLSQIINAYDAIPYPEGRWYLDTHNWQLQMPAVEKYVELLKSKGL